VTDTDEGRQALAREVELTDRLWLRLVLAQVADGIGSSNGVMMKGDREEAARLLARLAAEYAVVDRAECRVALGDPLCSWDRSPARRLRTDRRRGEDRRQAAPGPREQTCRRA
jgi:hypothetical protein